MGRKEATMRKMYFLVVVSFIGTMFFGGCDKISGTPKLTQNCVMNGFGSGHCSFTNTGDAKGSACGKIKVNKKAGGSGLESSVFCSGELKPNSTTKVDFAVPGVNSLCEGGDWRENCEFGFVEGSD